MQATAAECSGLDSFLSFGESTRSLANEQQIGNKGTGAKSLFNANELLIVVTKTKDDSGWACMLLQKPCEYFAPKRSSYDTEVSHC